MARTDVVVAGASGLLGQCLVRQFHARGLNVIALGRGARPDSLIRTCRWISYDLACHQPFPYRPQILVHAAPLWLMPDFLRRLGSGGLPGRCIAFSSTSSLTKINARDARDRALARRLRQAEETVLKITGDSCGCTLVRPTMIYGYGLDKNVSQIAAFISRFGFFPVAGKARGRRQPVHADDLAAAVNAILDNKVTIGKTYNLAGAETLEYTQMVERIFTALGRRPRVFHIPVDCYRLLIRLQGKGNPPGAAERMNQDLDFDILPAMRDFGYAPRPFLATPARDLPGMPA